MIKNKTLLLSLLATMMASASVSALNDDPDVRVGTLPNGLTYYIRNNGSPANTVDFFIAQRVGSVNEEENQRGLAHFLEHMCFNGTQHFPGNSLISWLESVGVRFGENLNAYTSTDETVYNICKVPSARRETIDSCIMILSDWSHGLSLDQAEIDSERGVIVNEWRQRRSATNRMLERALPELYPGSRYGQRMPIGLMNVVENFKPEELRDYYHRWYYPANQAVVVVGDIDPDFVEERIRHHFGNIETPADAAEVPVYPVPDNEEIIVVTEKDPEQNVNLVQIHFKHDPMPDSLVDTDEGMRMELAASLAASMIAARFDDLERSEDCPHTYLGLGDTKFLMSRPKRSLLLRGVVKPGRAADAVGAWITELRRAMLHGFSDYELEMAKKENLASLESKAKKLPKISNTEYARLYVRHFLDGGSLASQADLIEAEKTQLSKIGLEEINAYLHSTVDLSGRNVVMLAYRPDKEDAQDILAEDLRAAFFAAAASTPEPFEVKRIDGDLMEKEPSPGSIVSEDSLGRFDAKAYVLSNGIRVLARRSAEVPGQIFVRGVGVGGFSQEYTPELAATMKMLNEGMAVSAFGRFSAKDLKRYLTGRDLKVSVAISNTEETVEASTSREDMRDAFRLMYLKVTDPRRDDDAYRVFATQKRNGLRNLYSSPVQEMGATIHSNVFSHHPLGMKETVETVDSADYGRMIEIYRNRFADMADFTFYVTGDFDEDSLRVCLADYVASLPAAGRIERQKDIGYRFTPGNNEVVFSREMETPQSVVYTFFTTPAEYELAEVIKATALGRIVQMRLLADLREDKGWTYSVRGHCSINSGMNGDDPSCLLMPLYIKLEPGHEEECAAIVRQTVSDIAAEGSSEEELGKVKEYLSKSFAENCDDNAYWLVVMKSFVKFGKDMHDGYLDVLSLITPADISHLAAKVRDGDRTLIIMKGVAKDGDQRAK